jgi:hypothetical protein
LSSEYRYIKSIFVDYLSAVDSNCRVWVIIHDHIPLANFITIIQIIRDSKDPFSNKDILWSIYTEGVFNFFLATQRILAFDIFHLTNYAEIIYGEIIFDRCYHPSRKDIVQMIHSSIPVATSHVRNWMYHFSTAEYRKIVFRLFAWKLFLQKNIIVTTVDDLSQAYAEYFSEHDTQCLKNSLGQVYSLPVMAEMLIKGLNWLNDYINSYDAHKNSSTCMGFI